MSLDQQNTKTTDTALEFPRTYLIALSVLAVIDLTLGVAGSAIAVSPFLKSQVTQYFGIKAIADYLAFCSVGWSITLMLAAFLITYRLARNSLDYRFSLTVIRLAVLGSMLLPSFPVAIYCWKTTKQHRNIFLDGPRPSTAHHGK